MLTRTQIYLVLAVWKIQR